MQEQPRRKSRIPLSPEELFYVIELKKIKQQEKIAAFKATLFFKIINRLNVFLAAFLTYCIFSILILCSWEKGFVSSAICTYGEYVPEIKQRTIAEIQLHLTNGKYIHLKASHFFSVPKINDVVFVGKDLLFNKMMKVKFANDDDILWSVHSYASLCLCAFALIIGFFVYNVNKHLTVNGLLTSLGLFVLAALYFILV